MADTVRFEQDYLRSIYGRFRNHALLHWRRHGIPIPAHGRHHLIRRGTRHIDTRLVRPGKSRKGATAPIQDHKLIHQPTVLGRRDLLSDPRLLLLNGLLAGHNLRDRRRILCRDDRRQHAHARGQRRCPTLALHLHPHPDLPAALQTAELRLGLHGLDPQRRQR